MATNRPPERTRSFTPLQDEILKVATDNIGPAVAVRIVSKKFEDVGVRMTSREKRELHQAILRGSIDEFSVTRRRTHAAVVTFTAKDGETLTAEALQRMSEVFNVALKQSSRHASDVLKTLHRKWNSEQRRQHREMVGFRRRLRKRWERAFALFHMFMTVYRESGEQMANAVIGTTANGRPLSARVLIELHGRSCQVR